MVGNAQPRIRAEARIGVISRAKVVGVSVAKHTYRSSAQLRREAALNIQVVIIDNYQ